MNQPIRSKKLERRRERCGRVNEFMVEIGNVGRGFFYRPQTGKRARMEVDSRGRVWFIDDYSDKRIFTHREGRWDGFSHGGTLKQLVQAFQVFITEDGGKDFVPAGHFGPWKDILCEGDLWGYGFEAMDHVRAAAVRLGIVRSDAYEREECLNGQRCCPDAGRYNGFGSGPTVFKCPRGCSCHD